MRFELEGSFGKKLKGRIEAYEFQVGVLDDKPHRNPVDINQFKPDPALFGNFAGDPIRKMSRETGPLSTGDILKANSERLGIDLLRAPFKKQSSDILRFTDAFLKSVTAKGSIKRVENLLQAIVRNPILRGDYGTNDLFTASAKGFNRLLFDTGQTFKAIRASAKLKRGV